MVELLVLAGAVVDRPKIQGITALNIAVQKGHLCTVRLLLQLGANANRVRPDHLTPLYLACWIHHEPIVELLLTQGKVFTQTQPSFFSKSSFSIRQADPNSGTVDAPLASTTATHPLYLAALHNDVRIAELLLKHGARVDIQQVDNSTPAFVAAFHGHTEILELFHTHKVLFLRFVKKNFYSCSPSGGLYPPSKRRHVPSRRRRTKQPFQGHRGPFKMRSPRRSNTSRFGFFLLFLPCAHNPTPSFCRSLDGGFFGGSKGTFERAPSVGGMWTRKLEFGAHGWGFPAEHCLSEWTRKRRAIFDRTWSGSQRRRGAWSHTTPYRFATRARCSGEHAVGGKGVAKGQPSSHHAGQHLGVVSCFATRTIGGGSTVASTRRRRQHPPKQR